LGLQHRREGDACRLPEDLERPDVYLRPEVRGPVRGELTCTIRPASSTRSASRSRSRSERTTLRRRLAPRVEAARGASGLHCVVDSLRETKPLAERWD